MMPKRDQPIIGIGGHILLEPFEHRGSGSAVGAHRIKADEMNVTVVERIVTLGS